VLSEESGLVDGSAEVVVIVDPVDGSTNASLGIPWFATSLCAVRDGVAIASLVVNLASGERFEAVRGEGAWRNGQPISSSGCSRVSDAVVGLSGLPPRHLGWAQFRALGAAALDMCAVACGRLDAYVDCSFDAHGVWDYAGALLVCEEAGATVRDALGRELIVMDHAVRRTPIAAASGSLCASLVTARVNWR
ncbi:MAG: inositol monophosphatase, partial [Acidimicrobiia bacterium]